MVAGKDLLVPPGSCRAWHFLGTIRGTLNELVTVGRMLPVLLASGAIYTGEVAWCDRFVCWWVGWGLCWRSAS